VEDPKYTYGVQVDKDQLCDIFHEKRMLLPLARKLVYFLTMRQRWDYLEMAVEKSR
jgi:hypothetical protein